MAKPHRLSRAWRTLRVRRPQSLPALSKRLSASFRSIITRTTNQHDLNMPRSEDAVYEVTHEANPRPASDEGIICKTPETAEAFEVGYDVETGDGHERGRCTDAKEAAGAISAPSSSAQEKRKRSGEHDDSTPESARHALEDITSAPSEISRKPSTKKEQEIINWVNQQPGTPHLSGHDAEQAPEFPPSRSNSGGLGEPGDRFDSDMTEEEKPQPTEFIHSRSSSPRRFHFSRPPHTRIASLDPKTRGIHRPTDLVGPRTDAGVLIGSSVPRIAT